MTPDRECVIERGPDDDELHQKLARRTVENAAETARRWMLPSPKAAEYIGVKPQTMRAWRTRGTHFIPYSRYGKTGSRVYYDIRDLDEFINRRTFISTSAETVGTDTNVTEQEV